MARPRMQLGDWGNINTQGMIEQDGRWLRAPEGVKVQRWRARARVRDTDGVRREVERWGTTKAKAENLLTAALRERTAPRGSDALTPDTTVLQAGEYWLVQVRRPDADLSANTVGQYASSFDRYVRGSSIEGLTLREVNRVPVIRGWLQRVADERGSGSAKTARSALSSILTLAVHDGVLDMNAARQVKVPRGITARESARDTSRALTREERDDLLAYVAADEVSQARDVVDLIHWMAGTGVRISEALDQRWRDVDLDEGRVLVRGTKTATSTRTLVLPGWLVERLRDRKDRLGVPTSGLLLASPVTGRRRDVRNATRQIRDVLDRAGFPWATAHTFRRTVATLIDQAGLPVALAADQLGHASPAMTMARYFGRGSDTSRAAEVL